MLLMDNNYKKKLQKLGVHFGTKDKIEFKPKKDLAQIDLDGETKTNSYGEFFYSEQKFHGSYKHGSIALNEILTPDIRIKLPDLDTVINPADCVYLDTETTGLSTSGGTFAFMVGLGYFENENFILRQYFLRDPHEEEAVLLDLDNLLSNHSTMITYNGVSFDVPILKSRYRYHRIPSEINKKNQIDLLKYSRILFRYQFDDRSLKNIEANVLDFNRTAEEIPGWMAPIIYQDYLKTKNNLSIMGVFYHNAMDILSLAALITIINQISLIQEDQFLRYETLNYSLACLYEKNKEYFRAIEAYLRAIEQNNLPRMIKTNCFHSLAELYKKTGQITEAVLYWQQASELGKLESLIELAKIYEHQLKDYQIAINYCKRALLLLENNVNSIYKELQTRKIEHRINRLTNKVKS